MNQKALKKKVLFYQAIQILNKINFIKEVVKNHNNPAINLFLKIY